MFHNIKRSLKFLFGKERELYYFGKYATWEEAEKESEKYGAAYSSDNILERVSGATEKVRSGEGVYEQDGIVFYEENNNYELIAALLLVYSHRKSLRVLDFGGALGSTYFRYRKLLEPCECEWTIIEQKHYVEYGKNHIPEINFLYDIAECAKEVDVILLSSVLGYLDDTYAQFKRILEQKAEYVIIDELAFSPDDTETVMLQHVPARIYSAVYPVRILSLTGFKQFIKDNGYEVAWEWDYRFGNIPVCEGLKVYDTVEKGFLLRLQR